MDGDSGPAGGIETAEASVIQCNLCQLKTEQRSPEYLMTSTFWTLRDLYLRDPSSLDFLLRLQSLIRRDEEEQYLSSLRGSGLTRLVDFLDELRAVPSAFHQFTKHSVGP